MLGFGPLSAAPLSSLPDDFSAAFPVDDGKPGESVIEIASFVDRALIERLKKYPDDLRLIDRRRFEELIAELFFGFGYEVELTRRTRDGGKDIIAIKRKEVNVKFLIECKRPDPGNAVAVSTVRELLGVKVDEGATKAILVTTTYFSPDAKRFFDKHLWDLEPREYEDVKQWIADYLSIKAK